MTRLNIKAAKAAGLYKKSKYHNVKTQVDGYTFDSKAEARRYVELKQLQQAGEIIGFGRQPSFLLQGGIRYRPDFVVCGSDGSVWVEDVKGMQTDTFKTKHKLWLEAYPWLELRIVK